MKISWNFLQGLFSEPLDKAMVLERLTMTGLEVEDETPVAPEFSGVVVAEVVSCEPHPDADKLTVCQVNTGAEQLVQILCGAPNVKPGVRVPCAKVGAVLPDNFKIAERKMRGLPSYGMLCGGDEIGCPDGVDGLLILANDAPIGMDIRSYLELDDTLIEFKITPNRGDCLSYLGLAREVAALTGATLKSLPMVTNYLTKPSQTLKLNVTATSECPHYVALAIANVDNSCSSPQWLQRLLARSGVRSISPIVDITNYVMLLIGQPMHAFELAQVGTGISVRLANDGEQLTLLDNTQVTLSAKDLIIANGNNQPIALAGVMGGLTSGVTPQTQAILLESACFSRAAIQGQAKHFGISSDSAYRFERGIDPQIQITALNLAAQLIAEICGGVASEFVQFTADNHGIKPAVIELSYREIDAFIGQALGSELIHDILIKLGCQVVANNDQLQVTPPSYRFDLAIKADIIEEIIRVYGYDKIEAKMPKLSHSLNYIDEHQVKLAHLKQVLVGLGLNEIISYAFIEDKYSRLFANCAYPMVKLQNPIAGLTKLRNSLLPGLVKTLVVNVNRNQHQVRIFELARVFYGEEANAQPLMLAGLIYGPAAQVNWAQASRPVDYYDLKLIVEELLTPFTKPEFKPLTNSEVVHPGRSASILVNGVVIGWLGQLHPKFSAELGLTELPYGFEINLELFGFIANPKLKELSKFPQVSRDLAFVVKQHVPSGDMLQAIGDLALAMLQEVRVFDVFSGGNLSPDEKSIALNLVFQADKTLTEDEINANLQAVKDHLAHKFTARLR